MTKEDLQQARTRFAKQIQQQGHIQSAGLIEGLGTVPRENFVGPGPWKIMRAGAYQLTPDDNPRHLYDNVLVALDERRMLNNGEPLALLLFLDSLTLSAGDAFLHIGCGVGYYTAIAAHALGPHGSVVAAEIDPTFPTMPGIGAGSMLLVTRGETEYSAKFTSPVGIFHCEGARSAEEEALLAKAFAEGDRASVCRLRRDAHGRGPNCWLHTSDVCLT
jgi:hypothetical protein